ncbi:hypothetical protein V0U79_07195 [Hyphobacterium sp. HN65]|uniref:DUF4440 domain-containing protein n=1 Tax=Hyphobacterium lacteum TaxID=3116575 RepID=A0ABU7LQG6_9PROT|nr:hypothetical protein [Hyphobacterium sp. HN65]MEE2526147.1 hypothetical protein [Hyphobacterium sp. HN65]
MSDEDEIRDVVREIYAMISGPAGPRDWSRHLDYFHPDCRQIRTGMGDDSQPWAVMMSPDEYRENVTDWFNQTAFYEIELACEVRVFGNMAHAWSSYEARTDLNAPTPERRGINSIQFYKDESGKWRIISMIWDNEREGLSLPADMEG